MRTTETIRIILVEPIATEEELREAQEALDMLQGAEPGSEAASKHSRIARMIRDYEQRGRRAVRNAGEASAEWTSEHRSGIGWIAAGAASVAAAGLGLARWKKAKEEATLRGRVRSLADRSTKRVAKVGKAGKKVGKKAGKTGWQSARNRIKHLT